MSNDPEQILRASMQDFGESKSSSRSSHRADHRSHTSKYESPQHCSGSRSHNWESLMGISDHHDRSAYKKGGSIRAAAQKLKRMGRGGDTDVVHVNEKEKRVLKAMGGRGTINPKTGLREYSLFGGDAPLSRYRDIKNDMYKFKRAAEDLEDLPGGFFTKNNAMAEFLDKKHQKTQAKLEHLEKVYKDLPNLPNNPNHPNYQDHQNTRAELLDNIQKLKWKSQEGKDIQRTSRAAKQAMRYSNPELLGLHDMFEGKKSMRPTTMTDLSRRDMLYGHTNINNALLDNQQLIQRQAMHMLNANPDSLPMVGTDELGMTASQARRNNGGIEAYHRPFVTSQNLEDAVRNASLVRDPNNPQGPVLGGAFVSGNGETFDPVEGNDNRQKLIKNHNSADGNLEQYDDQIQPVNKVRNSTYYAYNGHTIGEHHKKNPYQEVTAHDMALGNVFVPGEGKFVPNQNLSKPIQKYFGDKLGHTTCMEANYRTDLKDANSLFSKTFEQYPKTAMRHLASDVVEKSLSKRNAEILNNHIERNDPLNFVPHSYSGVMRTPNTYEKDHFGVPGKNTLQIENSTRLNRFLDRNNQNNLDNLANLNNINNRAHINVNTPDATDNMVSPFLLRRNDGGIERPNITTHRLQGANREAAFTSTAQPISYQPGYGRTIIPSYKVK